ncbi:hypothetical protein L3Q67_45290 (plasmid) [Saccharothrix sp. AJ9571]|nr:hypothetical protein L3Q67_45290 [Saccharothrix sp. AJ9571]
MPTPQPPEREARFQTVATSLLAAAVLGGVILLVFLNYDVTKSDFTVSHGTLPGELWQGTACTYYPCASQHVDWRWTLDPGAQIATTFTTDATTHHRLLGHELQLDNDGNAPTPRFPGPSPPMTARSAPASSTPPHPPPASRSRCPTTDPASP